MIVNKSISIKLLNIGSFRLSILLVLFILIFNNTTIAQNSSGVKIGDNVFNKHQASLLELESTNKGLLLPRIQDTALINIFSPPDGMMIYVIEAQGGQHLYIRQNGFWSDIPSSSSLTNVLQSQLQIALNKKAIKSLDGSISIQGGDSAVFRDVMIMVDKSKVVTDTIVSKLFISTLIIDSLSKAVGKGPFKDSIISIIDSQLRLKAKSIISNDPLIKISGGTGAVLESVSIAIDTNQLGHLLSSRPLLDSLAVAFKKAPLYDTLNNIITSRLPDLSKKLNISDTSLMLSYYAKQQALVDTAYAIRKSLGGFGTVSGGIDSFYTASDTLFIQSKGIWKYSIIDTFTANPTIQLASGNTFGKYSNGSIPNWRGMSARQAILDALVQAVPPIYRQPSNSILSVPKPGEYEIGTNLGMVSLSATFTQNDAGSFVSNTFYKNNNAIQSNSDFIGSLTSTIKYKVVSNYNQGACKENNLKSIDCNNRVSAGSITSSEISFLPYYNRYYGFINSTTPSSSDLLNLSEDHVDSRNLNVILENPSASKYLCFCYSSLLGALANISVNGFPSSAAFSISKINFTNKLGYTSEYYLVIGNNKVDKSTVSNTVFEIK